MHSIWWILPSALSMNDLSHSPSCAGKYPVLPHSVFLLCESLFLLLTLTPSTSGHQMCGVFTPQQHLGL